MRGRHLLATALAAAVLTAPGAAAAPADVVQTYTVWQWNIAGHKMNAGSTTNGIVQAAVDSIISADADLVSFNEICWNQYKAIQSSLATRGWPDSADYSRFAATREADPNSAICGDGQAFGQALFSKADLGTSRQYELPWDRKAGTRKLLCAPLQATPLMKFCTTHITTQTEPPPGGAPGTDPKTLQIAYVLDLLDGFDAAGETYLIAGDFNAQPHYDRLNAYYSPSVNTINNNANVGEHRELDDADAGHCPGYGDWTSDAPPPTLSPCDGYWRLDLIFAREDRIVGSYTSDALPIPRTCTGQPDKRCADHRIVTGTVSLRVGTS